MTLSYLRAVLVFLKFWHFSCELEETESLGATESEVWIGNFNVKAWKTTAHKLHKIWGSLKFRKNSGKGAHPCLHCNMIPMFPWEVSIGNHLVTWSTDGVNSSYRFIKTINCFHCRWISMKNNWWMRGIATRHLVTVWTTTKWHLVTVWTTSSCDLWRHHGTPNLWGSVPSSVLAHYLQFDQK